MDTQLMKPEVNDIWHGYSANETFSNDPEVNDLMTFVLHF